jgi:hypothetical protein
MRTPAVVRVFVGALGLVAIGLAGVLLPGALSRAQTPPPKASTARPPTSDVKAGPKPASPSDLARDEPMVRAREEVESLELQLGAKRAQLKKAETRLELERILLADYEKLKKAGIGSSIGQKRADLGVLEAEAERTIRLAEETEAEKRYVQAKRRLTALARRGGPSMGILETMGRDVRALEGKIARVEEKLDLLVQGMEDAKDEIVRLKQQVQVLLKKK